MKKLKLFFACLLMAVLSIGQVWAETQAVLNSVSTKEVVSTAGQSVSKVFDGVTCQVTKTGGSTSPGFYTSSGIVRYYTNDVMTLSVESGNTISQIDFVMTSGSVGTASEGTLSSNTWTGNAESVSFTGGATVKIASITVTYSSGGSTKTLSSVAVSGTPTKTEYYAGQDFDPAGLTVTGTYSDASQQTFTSGITWAYNPSQTLALNQTSIGVTATVSEITSEVFTVNDLTVTEAPAAASYEKVTAAPSDWSGEYLIVYENGATAYVWTGVDAVSCYATATISNDVIAQPEGTSSVTIASMEGGYSILVNGGTNDGKYIQNNGTSNGIKFVNAGVATTLTYENNAVTITCGGKMFRYNNASGNDRFRYFGSAQQVIQLYKKVDGTVKPSADLAFDAAQKLAKVAGTLTAPNLSTADGFDGTVTYASSDEAVVKVNASTGAITEIVAVGKAVITAHSDETENFREGSASYTIFVAEQAGTNEDPLTEASAKALIDDGCTLTVHVNGLVLSQNSTNFTVTLTNGFQFYKAKDLNNVAFESAYLGAGDEVTAVGALKKFSSTYELDEGCYLTFYEAATTPLTPIANDKDHPYTVAQALAFAAAPTTYDLSDHVFIQGVVYKANSFNSDNGTYNIYIKDAGTSEDDGKFEFFKCSGLYQVGEAVVPFEEGDVQEGDEVIGYGVMTYYSGASIWEFGQPNQLVSLNRPVVAVTGIDLTESTAEVEVGSTVTLHASVVPGNATDQGIVWSVTSGSDKASVDENGVVTGTAAGEAVIRAASHEDASIYEECTVTVTAVDPAKHVVTFDATLDYGDSPLVKGDITMTCTSGALNNQSEYRLYKSSTTTFACSVGNITKIEFTGVSGNPVSGFGDPEVGTLETSGNDGVWTGNAESVAFAASGAQVRATLIKVTYKEDNRDAAGLAWDPAEDITLTVGDAFTAPTLLNPNSIDAAEITIESSNPAVATVTAGVVALVADATGTTTITATFAGNDDYKPATISYNITVNEAGLDNVTFDSSEDHAESGETTITKGGFTLSFTSGSMDGTQAEYRLYKSQTMTLSSTDYLIKKIEFTCTSGNPITGFADATGLDKDNNEWTGESNTVELTASNAQVRMTKIKVFYVEDTRAAAGLAWNPAGDIELTVGDALTAPALLNPNSIDAAEITIESSNTDLATVSEGVVSLVADATGTTTITATFAGNDDYKPATVSYKITVNPAYSIYVTPSLYVNFGNVDQDAEVADKTITVTLTGVDAATLTLAGDGASAFTISPAAALTASGDITISASSANLGTFAATLTISDDASQAESKVVHLSLTVNEVVVPETPVSTTSEWVAATEIVDGMQVLIVGVNGDDVYAMGAQTNNNRTAVQGSVDGEGVFTPGDNTMAFTLVAQGDGTYAIKASNNKYLYAAASGSNHLKTQDEVDVNAKWTLTVASAVAEGSSNRNVMQFNSGSSIFSCYASASQKAIALYVPKPVTPPTADYTRPGLTVGNYATICLPNGGTISGATLFDLDYYDGANTLYLLEVTGNAMVAGRPYVFLPSGTSIEVFYTDDANAPAGSFNGLVGSYSETTILANAGNYILWKNAYYFVDSQARVGANRAYIHMEDVDTEPSTLQLGAAPRRRVAMTVNGKDAAQGFENLQSGDAPVKVMIDGTMYILRGEKVYDATGRLVK